MIQPEIQFQKLDIRPTVPVFRDIRTRWTGLCPNDMNRLFYVLNGGFILNDGEQSYAVRKNQMALLPAGGAHTYWRMPNFPLSILMFRFSAEYNGEDIFRYSGLLEGNPVVNLPEEPILHCYRQMTASPPEEESRSLQIRCCAYTAVLCSLYADARFSITGAMRQHQDVIDYMHAHVHTDLTLEQLATAFNYDLTYFVKVFKKRMGTSPMRYFGQLRAQKAAGLLKNSTLSVYDVAREIGFADVYYFKTFFARHMGVRPETYRDMIIGLRGAGEIDISDGQ